MNLDYGATDEVGRFVCHRTGGTYEPGCSAAIGMRNDAGELVAGVLFDHYNGRSIAMHVAGDGGHWMTRQFLRASFRYPFRQLKVNKVIGFVDSANRAARKLDEHLGFIIEARLKDAGPQADLLLMSMTADQCRYLGDDLGTDESSSTAP